MSGSSPRAHGTPFKEHAGAQRTNGHTRGHLYCRGCGASTVTVADFCDAAGVTSYMLRKWLDKLPVPQAIADRIRANLAEVKE